MNGQDAHITPVHGDRRRCPIKTFLFSLATPSQPKSQPSSSMIEVIDAILTPKPVPSRRTCCRHRFSRWFAAYDANRFWRQRCHGGLDVKPVQRNRPAEERVHMQISPCRYSHRGANSCKVTAAQLSAVPKIFGHWLSKNARAKVRL